MCHCHCTSGQRLICMRHLNTIHAYKFLWFVNKFKEWLINIFKVHKFKYIIVKRAQQQNKMMKLILDSNWITLFDIYNALTTIASESMLIFGDFWSIYALDGTFFHFYSSKREQIYSHPHQRHLFLLKYIFNKSMNIFLVISWK